MELATLETRLVDSDSVGDPACFLTLAELERGLGALTRSPADRGQVALVVRRGEGGRREVLEAGRLAVEGGLVGDDWARWPDRNPQAELAVMQAEVAALIANGQPLTLFGDNLFLDLDLSAENLPLGSRLRVGAALLEVTPKPHNGCKKFHARFGPEALRFSARADLRHRNLRGIYLQVIEAGDVRPGDPVEVVARGPVAL